MASRFMQQLADAGVPGVAPVLARMKAEGYFLSDVLVREVLRRAGEAV